MSNQKPEGVFPLEYQRVTASCVKVICDVKGERKEVLARVVTEGTYSTQAEATHSQKEQMCGDAAKP